MTSTASKKMGAGRAGGGVEAWWGWGGVGGRGEGGVGGGAGGVDGLAPEQHDERRLPAVPILGAGPPTTAVAACALQPAEQRRAHG